MLAAQAVTLSPGVSDTITWTEGSSRQYTACSAYLLQFQSPARNDLRFIIWKPWAPGKMKIFAWLLHLNRLWCNDRLQRRGWINGYFCPLCIRHLESSVHLFWECPLALQIWRKVATWRGCSILNLDNWSGFGCTMGRVQSILQQAITEKERKAMRSVITLVCWEIWKKRNACTFLEKIVSTQDVLRSITQNIEL